MADLTLVPRRTPTGVVLKNFQIRNGQASVGRGAHCDWILPDPERLLSKRHCEITSRNGQWLITDFSSNGTTVGGRLLPPGVPHPLQDQDRIGCGAYQIDVLLHDEEIFSVPNGDPTLTDIPETSLPDALPPTQNGPVSASGAGIPAAASSPPDLSADPSALSGTRQIPGADLTGSAPRFAQAPPRYGRGMTETLSVIHPFNFALDSEDSRFPLADGAEQNSTASKASLSEDVSALPPGTSGLHDAFVPPRPASALLPEDWNDPATRAEPLPGLVSSPSPEPDRGPPHSASPISQSQDASALLAAFMRGTGLAGTPEGNPERFFEDLGRTFRAVVIGLRRAMIARSEIKGEFRIEQTMIQPSGNNPLKFAVDDDDALSALLSVGRRTGITGAEAVADTLRDIQVHEMALTSAIEPAMRELLAASSPTAVLEQLGYPAGPPLSLLRRAKAWTTYARQHDTMAAATGETLDGAFGRAFGRAYEAARADYEGQTPPRHTGRPTRDNQTDSGEGA